MDDMWRASVCAGVAVGALLLGGCGVAVPADRGRPAARRSRPAAGPPATPRSGSGPDIDAGNDDRPGRTVTAASGSGPDEPGPKFPMTLRRTGGIAAFDDRVVVQANGRLVVETRLVRGRTCSLTPAQR